jgi:membrane protein implicated in regulation of membrane protease activity
MFTLLPILALALFFVLPPYVAGALWVCIAGGCGYARWRIHRSVQFPPQTGIESMAGRAAVVVDALRPTGTIRYQGEIWRAACDEGLPAGACVRILRVDRRPEGFTAVVEPLDRPGADAVREVP